MSSHTYAAPLVLEPRPSSTLRTLVVCAFLGAIVCVTLLPMFPWLKLGAIVGSVPLFLATWRRQPALGGEPVTVVWDAYGRWLWRSAGDECRLTLEGDSYVTPCLVILLFRSGPTKRTLVVAPGTLDSETFRRLRVRLRMDREHDTPEDA